MFSGGRREPSKRNGGIVSSSAADVGSPFVGADRALVVDGLVKVFERVRKTRESHWVSIEAPSGWGKTRLVQEFYAELVKHCQNDPDVPPYWPSQISESIGSTAKDLEIRRKQLFPEVRHVPGSLPTFAWWGVGCSLRNGIPSVALAEDMAQFEGHAPYLDDAWRIAMASGIRGLPWKSASRAAGEEVVMEVAGAVLEAAIGSAVPGLGFVKWIGERTISSVRSSNERSERLVTSPQIGRDHSGLVDEISEKLTKLGRGGIPVVVFVEDAHFAHETLVDLLQNLMAPSSSVLIITTAWSGFIQENDALADVLERAVSKVDNRSTVVTRIKHDSVQLPPPFPEIVSLESLLPEDRERLVRFYYPHADADTCAALAVRYENPLALELVCTMPRIRDRFPDGGLVLTPKEIANLPGTVKGLYNELWKHLPDEVRKALSLAALGIPQLISPSLGRSAQWHHPSLSGAARRLEPLGNTADILLDESAAFSWAKHLSDRLGQFHQPGQMNVASEDDSYFDGAAVHPLLAEIASGQLLGDDLATENEIQHAADTVFALHDGGFSVDPEALVLAATMRLELVSGYPKEVAETVHVAEIVLNGAGKNSRRARDLRHQLGTALLELGRSAEATVLFEGVVAELEQAGSSFSSAGFIARNNLACSYADSGLIDEAIICCEELIDDHGQFEGIDPAEMLSTRNNLAFFYGEVGRVPEAITLCEALLSEQEQMPAADDPDTLSTRANLASLYRAGGRVDEALATGERVVLGRVAVLGPKHAHTLSARGNLGIFYSDAGRLDEAIKVSQALLRDRDEIQGGDHPETLNERSLLAQYYNAAGRFDEAMRCGKDVLRDQLLYLGSDHPDTLISRFNIACFHGQAGHTDTAIEMFKALLPDRERVLGMSHPGTISVRENLSYLTAMSSN
jgi:tetratricopeptide (TPR) repeat protein